MWLKNLVRDAGFTAVAGAMMVLSSGAAVSAQEKAPAASIAIVPVQQWRVESAEGDKVTLSEKQGCLQIDYDVDIRAIRQSGHETFKQSSFRIVLNDARPLADGEERVLFDARGVEN